MPAGYQARAEQVVVFRIGAWDANCPQHIALRLDAAAVHEAPAQRDQPIRELEAQLAQRQTG